MPYTPPSIADFKLEFHRDFPYGPATNEVNDADITKAIGDAAFNFNEGFFSSQANYDKGYLNLAAHYMVMNLRASSQGVAAAYDFLNIGKGAGSVSESISIPQRILDHPILSMYAKTPYGAKYLSFILPQLVGVVHPICGRTHA